MASAFLDAPGPLAFAHRGGAAHAPENSWRAFEHAVGLGYRYLETDLQATSDGVLVAFHDKTLTRVCGLDGRVRRLSYAELSAARINGTEPIPMLEDLLTAWPDIRFNLDVKGVSAIAPLPEVLRRTNAWDRVCVVSFSASRLRATRRALGRPVCMAASPLGTAVVRLGGPRGRHDRTGPARGQGPVKERGPEPSGGSGGSSPRASTGGSRGRLAAPGQNQWPLADWLTRSGVRCVQVPAPMAAPSFIARSHALGLQVHVWTVNDQPTMQRLLDLGVDGIMTDETVALREVLTARGQWHPRPDV
ncbi:MAG TPA: glycerophosphodiester phosphodiesterase family protein [Streptosporangiaceae bacterium]|nr:glycerophosphodiester phosphodiesterase family protein [Streptosporangiaceae bacterium]